MIFNCELIQNKKEKIIKVFGVIKYENLYEVERVFRDAVHSFQDNLIIDLSDLEYYDSSFMSLLIEIRMQMDKSQRNLILTGLPDRFLNFIRIAELDQYFIIWEKKTKHSQAE